MTVTYTNKVTRATTFGCFLKLLLRWRGSIYKLVWVDLVIFLVLYYLINLSYLYLLDYESKRHFVRIVTYFAKYGSLIPLSFVLGFYVNVIYNRWWSQYTTIPYPDNIAILVGASIHGQDDRAKIIRRTIVRYVCVAFTITLTMMSPKVKKRFPTAQHLVEAGILTNDERKLMEDIDKEFPSYAKYWLPLAWASNVTTRAKNEGVIKDELAVKDILEELNEFRSKCRRLLDYDWISVPLVYTQVVTLAVYTYFLVTVLGTQFIETDDKVVNKVLFTVPIMPVIEFFFYMGWLKVAESLINPFGEDDDDFDVVWMIDRHIQVCYLLVDKIHDEHPKLVKDHYWGKVAPKHLPYTIASQKYMYDYPIESTTGLSVKKPDQDVLIFEKDDDEENDALLRKRSKPGALGRMMNMFHQNQNNSPNVQLKRVSIEMGSKESINDEVNAYGKDLNVEENVSEAPELPEEFATLRKARILQRKNKILKCIELLEKRGDKYLLSSALDQILDS